MEEQLDLSQGLQKIPVQKSIHKISAYRSRFSYAASSNPNTNCIFSPVKKGNLHFNHALKYGLFGTDMVISQKGWFQLEILQRNLYLSKKDFFRKLSL